MIGREALVVDSSAVVAILLGEPGRDELVCHLDRATTKVMSAATRVELGIVLEARAGLAGPLAIAQFLAESAVAVVDVTLHDAERALRGWRRFGKGNHPAGLNFGDCFVYALAERTGLPVLCTGDDFAATDLEVVRPGVG